MKKQFKGIQFHNPYLGDRLYNAPPYFRVGCSNDTHGQALHDKFKELMQKYPTIVYKHVHPDMTIQGTAQLLAEGKIIAWAQGRAEIGPRALGNRSILCSPQANCNKMRPTIFENWSNGGVYSHNTMKDVINEKVKHREYWRPFAPISLVEDAFKYFDIDHEQPYMLESPLAKDWKLSLDEIRPLWHDIPAVVHVDGTCRVQTVTSTTNNLIFQLLTKYKEISYRPGILLNTSLNDRGKPIANDLHDILNLLRDTELDYAVVDNWIFSKK